MNSEPIIITINKSDLNKITYEFARDFFDWCDFKGIETKEPRNEVTKKYETFVVNLDTKKKKVMFKNRFPNLFPINQ